MNKCMSNSLVNMHHRAWRHFVLAKFIHAHILDA